MAQPPKRLSSYKLSETTFRFNNIEPSQELLEQWAAILEKQAKVAASLVLQDGFEIEVVVEEGSIRSAVTLFLSLGLTTLQILGTDYKIVGENIAWLQAKSEQFANVLVQQVKHDSKQLPSIDVRDRSVIIRRSNTGVKRLKDLLQAEVLAHLDSRSPTKRSDLVKKIRAMLRQCSSSDERTEMLSVLMQNSEIRAAFEAENNLMSGEDEPIHAARKKGVMPRSARKKAATRTRRLKPVVRRFTT